MLLHRFRKKVFANFLRSCVTQIKKLEIGRYHPFEPYLVIFLKALVPASPMGRVKVIWHQVALGMSLNSRILYMGLFR